MKNEKETKKQNKNKQTIEETMKCPSCSSTHLTKDYSRAEEMYGRVVELAPSYLDEALFNLAMVQHKQEKMSQTIENLERALAFNPNNEMAKKYLLKLKERAREDK